LENSSRYLTLSTEFSDYIIVIYKHRKRRGKQIWIDGVMFYCNKHGQRSFDAITNMRIELRDCIEYEKLNDIPDSVLKTILDVSNYFKLKKMEKEKWLV
jgi:hypothetical protein